MQLQANIERLKIDCHLYILAAWENGWHAEWCSSFENENYYTYTYTLFREH